MVFSYETTIRFSDADSMGHVNHARFLTYLEDARVAFLAGLPDGDGDLLRTGVIMARAEIDYARPIRLDDEPLRVELWVEKVGGRSFTLGYRILQRGELAARATTVIVAYDYAAATSRVLTEAERELLRAWEPAGK